MAPTMVTAANAPVQMIRCRLMPPPPARAAVGAIAEALDGVVPRLILRGGWDLVGGGRRELIFLP